MLLSTTLRQFVASMAGVLLVAAPRAADAADPYREVSLALGQALVALFPAAEGYVVSASAGEVYVDLAARDLVQPGMELQVYRPGAEMVHPVTRQVLGSYEKNLGSLRVTEVREKYSRGVLDAAGEGAGVAGGDRVRLSARRLRALLHVEGAAAGVEVGPLAQALMARGEESGRFSMVDEPAWGSALAALGAPWETVLGDPALLRRLGEATGGDLLLTAKIESSPIPAIALGVRSLRTGTALGELRERWSGADAGAAASAPPAPAGVSAPGPAPDTEGAYTVRDLSGPATSLAAGNILGERKTELVLTDGARLSVYRWEEKALSWLWDEAGRGGRRIITLDAADLDGDGRTEVIVAAVTRGRVTTQIRRWEQGELRIAGSIDGVYLRAVQRPGGGWVLLGQRSGIDEVLAGRVEEYLLRDGVPERIDGSALPAGIGIFGLAIAPPGGGVAFYALDRGGRLLAHAADGSVLWRSGRPYGGYPPPVQARELFALGPTDDASFDEETRAFQGRLLAEAVPGGVRLFVPRNFTDSPVLLVRQRSFGKGEVVVLEGPPADPGELGPSRSFDGYVADLAWADLEGDGIREILFVVNRFVGPLLGDRGKLIVWRRAGTGEVRK